MRLTLTYGFVVSSLALGACGGGGASGKANKEDLAKAVIEALTKKDKAAFSGLYVGIDTVMSACPDMSAMKDKLTERFAKNLAEAATGFDTCAGLDWSKAKPLETKGGDLRDPDKQCPSVTRVRDIEVVAEIDGKKVTIQLDDPIKVKDGFFLNDRFECEVEGAAAAAAPTEPTPEPAKEAAPEPAKEAAAAPAEPAGGAEKPAGDSVGNASCDKFIASFEKCIAALPEAARGPAADSIKQMRDSWSQVPDKSMLTGACDQALSSMKQSMGSMCPGVFE